MKIFTSRFQLRENGMEERHRSDEVCAECQALWIIFVCMSWAWKTVFHETPPTQFATHPHERCFSAIQTQPVNAVCVFLSLSLIYFGFPLRNRASERAWIYYRESQMENDVETQQEKSVDEFLFGFRVNGIVLALAWFTFVCLLSASLYQNAARNPSSDCRSMLLVFKWNAKAFELLKAPREFLCRTHPSIAVDLVVLVTWKRRQKTTSCFCSINKIADKIIIPRERTWNFHASCKIKYLLFLLPTSLDFALWHPSWMRELCLIDGIARGSDGWSNHELFFV